MDKKQYLGSLYNLARPECTLSEVISVTLSICYTNTRPSMLDKGQGAIRAGHLKNLKLWPLSCVQGPVFDWWHLMKKDAGTKKQRTNKTANCKSFRRTNPSQQVSVNTASWRSSWKEIWPTIWSIQWSLLLSPSPFTRYLSENVQIDSHKTRNGPNSPHQVTSLHCEVDRLCSTFLPVHPGQITNGF